jgi:thiol-disulfide isomerase/thioredoxin
VNFWATWCGPCKKEIPAFNRTYLEYKDKGVEFLGVLYDNQVDDVGLLNFMSDYEMTYPVIRADRPVLEAYAYPRALPTTFVYDKRGKLLLKHAGPLSDAALKQKLDEALAAK